MAVLVVFYLALVVGTGHGMMMCSPSDCGMCPENQCKNMPDCIWDDFDMSCHDSTSPQGPPGGGSYTQPPGGGCNGDGGYCTYNEDCCSMFCDGQMCSSSSGGFR